MSTYLLAFASGGFEHLENSYTSPPSGKKRPLRIYGVPCSLAVTCPRRRAATKDLIGQAQLCLDVTARAMPVYEQVFNVE
jgi:aminopeptidase 2